MLAAYQRLTSLAVAQGALPSWWRLHAGSAAASRAPPCKNSANIRKSMGLQTQPPLGFTMLPRHKLQPWELQEELAPVVNKLIAA